jgi:ATP/maltotriose-dependent transcriptional regulator MalT
MYRGDFDLAVATMESSLALYQEIESEVVNGVQFLSLAYANLGQMTHAQGNIDRAARLAEEALRRQRALDFTWALGDTLRIIGNVDFARGDNDHALAAYRESILFSRDNGDRRFLTNAIASIADVAAAKGSPELAVRLYAAATMHREQIGAGVEILQRSLHERGISIVRAALSPEDFDAAWAAGSTLSLSGAIAEALGNTEPAAITGEKPARNAMTLAGLTTREQDVLRLLAEGLSDRDIAKVLEISPRTVGGHITNLLAKLNVESRTAAVTYAVRHGFV